MSASNEDTGDLDLTCTFCQDILTSPKILPCFDTLCRPCLEQLAIRHGAKGHFPCPSCRQEVQIPAAGVSAFKDNVYIDTDLLSKAQQGLLCVRHQQREVELYCVDCAQCICLACKLQDHLRHRTENFEEATKRTRAELSSDAKRINWAVATMLVRIQEVDRALEDLTTKHNLLASGICSRHEATVHAVNGTRDEASASLNAVTEEQDASLAALISTSSKVLAEMERLQQKGEESHGVTTVPELLNIAKEIKEGFGIESALQLLTPTEGPTVSLSVPYSSFDDTLDVIIPNAEALIGSIVKIQRGLSDFGLDWKPHITCGKGREIYSLCPDQKGGVLVCFTPSVLCANSANVQRYDSQGKDESISVSTKDTGCKPDETSFKYLHENVLASVPNTKYVKSSRLFILCSELSGTTEVKRITVKSEHPLVVSHETVFFIVCGKLRACDTDKNEKWLAVVEEAVAPETQNKLKLFQWPPSSVEKRRGSDPEFNPRPDKKPPSAFGLFKIWNHFEEVAPNVPSDPLGICVPEPTPVQASHTYQPPDSYPFQPKDVCFYDYEGSVVLLVADEMDAVHVLTVTEDRLQFVQYLNAESPLMIQPTALNVDQHDRLFVACRGGAVLVGTRIEMFQNVKLPPPS